MKRSISRRPGYWLNKKEFRFVYSRVPRLCVDVLIFTRDGFILTRRDIPPYRGMWHFPGGGVRYRESVDEAIERVGVDEVGVSVRKIAALGYCEAVREGRTFRHSVSIVFAGRIISGSLTVSERAREIKSFRQIPKNIIPPQGFF